METKLKRLSRQSYYLTNGRSQMKPKPYGSKILD